MKIFIRNDTGADNRGRLRKGQVATRPAMDLVEGEEGIALFCDVPGVNPDRLYLCLADGSLYLWGETAFSSTMEGHIHALEFDDMVYEASFPLPRAVSGSDIEASLSNGVLTVLFRPPVQSGPRSIPVSEG